jgi:hypothetical protein
MVDAACTTVRLSLGHARLMFREEVNTGRSDGLHIAREFNQSFPPAFEPLVYMRP